MTTQADQFEKLLLDFLGNEAVPYIERKAVLDYLDEHEKVDETLLGMIQKSLEEAAKYAETKAKYYEYQAEMLEKAFAGDPKKIESIKKNLVEETEKSMQKLTDETYDAMTKLEALSGQDKS